LTDIADRLLQAVHTFLFQVCQAFGNMFLYK